MARQAESLRKKPRQFRDPLARRPDPVPARARLVSGRPGQSRRKPLEKVKHGHDHEVRRAAASVSLGLYVIPARTTTTEEKGLGESSPRSIKAPETKSTSRPASFWNHRRARHDARLALQHLAKILSGVKNNLRLSVCLDACHVFAAGYKMSTQGGIPGRLCGSLTKSSGSTKSCAFHLNDSVKDCGSRVHRHAPYRAG